jgi:hypothetical protein
MPPTAPNVRSSDESKSNISPNALEYDGKSESQKRARERRNKLKKVADTVPGNEKKHGTRTRQSWPSTTGENQREKPKRGTQPEHTKLLTTKYKRC